MSITVHLRMSYCSPPKVQGAILDEKSKELCSKAEISPGTTCFYSGNPDSRCYPLILTCASGGKLWHRQSSQATSDQCSCSMVGVNNATLSCVGGSQSWESSTVNGESSFVYKHSPQKCTVTPLPGYECDVTSIECTSGTKWSAIPNCVKNAVPDKQSSSSHTMIVIVTAVCCVVVVLIIILVWVLISNSKKKTKPRATAEP